MPRFANSGTNVDLWSETNDECSSTVDVCKKCSDYLGTGRPFPEPYGPKEPIGIMEDGIDHPDYADEEYHCFLCDSPLRFKDN